MKTRFLWAIPVIVFLTGCIHTETIRTADLSRERSREVNRLMPGYVAKLTFANGETARGRSVQITPDSISWISVETQTLRRRPVSAVENVSYHDALKGARTGALIGAGVGVAVGVGWSIHEMKTTSTAIHLSPYHVALLATAIVGVPSTLGGGILGAIVGDRERYVFTTTRADQNNSSSSSPNR